MKKYNDATCEYTQCMLYICLLFRVSISSILFLILRFKIRAGRFIVIVKEKKERKGRKGKERNVTSKRRCLIGQCFLFRQIERVMSDITFCFDNLLCQEHRTGVSTFAHPHLSLSSIYD